MLRPRSGCIGVFAAAVVVGAAGPAHGQVTAAATLEPTADTFVCADPLRADQNFGGAGALAFSPTASPKGAFRSLLRFDLTGIPAQMDARFGPGAWSVESATLELWGVPALHPIFNTSGSGLFAVDWLTSDVWVEGTGTPNAPTTNGVTSNTLSGYLLSTDRPLGTFIFPGGNGAFAADLDLEASFVADIEAGGLVSLFVRSVNGSAVFNSRQYTPTPSQHPRLTLVFTGPCRADLTTGAIPGQPGYGVPDGTLNNDDFFYYLSQFAAGNAAVADLTTGAIPGQAGYGIPNGAVNNDDFFFYLSIFAAGC